MFKIDTLTNYRKWPTFSQAQLSGPFPKGFGEDLGRKSPSGRVQVTVAMKGGEASQPGTHSVFVPTGFAIRPPTAPWPKPGDSRVLDCGWPLLKKRGKSAQNLQHTAFPFRVLDSCQKRLRLLAKKKKNKGFQRRRDVLGETLPLCGGLSLGGESCRT